MSDLASYSVNQSSIDKELEDCIAKNPSTNGQVNCLLKARDQWDEELNRIYRELRQKLNSEGQQVLKAAQLKWIDYRDNEFELIDSIYSGEGGSMQRVFGAFRKVEVMKTRVSNLNDYLNSIEEIK